MACDIHLYAEEESNFNQWELIGDFRLFNRRNYHLFGILAGVGEQFKESLYPRGLPPGLDPQTQKFFDTSNGYYSASWLTLRELLSFPWDEIAYDGGGTYGQLCPYFWSHTIPCLIGYGDPRIVFWFAD